MKEHIKKIAPIILIPFFFVFLFTATLLDLVNKERARVEVMELTLDQWIKLR